MINWFKISNPNSNPSKSKKVNCVLLDTGLNKGVIMVNSDFTLMVLNKAIIDNETEVKQPQDEKEISLLEYVSS